MVTLPLEYLNGWLFKINAARYKPDDPRREVIIRYQKESFIALCDYWHRGAAVNPWGEGSLPQISGAHQEEIESPSRTTAGIEGQICEALPPSPPQLSPENLTHLPTSNLDTDTSRLGPVLEVLCEVFGPERAVEDLNGLLRVLDRKLGAIRRRRRQPKQGAPEERSLSSVVSVKQKRRQTRSDQSPALRVVDCQTQLLGRTRHDARPSDHFRRARVVLAVGRC